jgi:DNA (cytosine-5)-methyltransferase 1
MNYYNEIDLFAAEWLRNLIKKGLIPDGEVDTRSIVDVTPDELRGYTQCHFFAGIGGWSHALRLAGWPDDRPVWTGSCPCQPFSVAGKGAGTDDPRHLWPHFHRLISACRPPVVMGEQVAGKAGYGWFDGVRADLEATGYAGRAVDIPALAVNAPHIRQRLYWVATDLENADRWYGKCGQVSQSIKICSTKGGTRSDHYVSGRRSLSHMADANSIGGDGIHERIKPRHMEADTERNGERKSGRSASGPSFWDDHVWLTGADGKSRRVKSSIPLLAHGVSNRVGRLRAYGNAIVPPLAAEVIKAFMDS